MSILILVTGYKFWNCNQNNATKTAYHEYCLYFGHSRSIKKLSEQYWPERSSIKQNHSNSKWKFRHSNNIQKVGSITNKMPEPENTLLPLYAFQTVGPYWFLKDDKPNSCYYEHDKTSYKHKVCGVYTWFFYFSFE